MRWKRRVKPKVDPYEWHLAFALIPHCTETHWVWLETAERRRCDDLWDGFYWEWRCLPNEEEV